jgi:hypothetical protein
MLHIAWLASVSSSSAVLLNLLQLLPRWLSYADPATACAMPCYVQLLRAAARRGIWVLLPSICAFPKPELPGTALQMMGEHVAKCVLPDASEPLKLCSCAPAAATAAAAAAPGVPVAVQTPFRVMSYTGQQNEPAL